MALKVAFANHLKKNPYVNHEQPPLRAQPVFRRIAAARRDPETHGRRKNMVAGRCRQSNFSCFAVQFELALVFAFADARMLLGGDLAEDRAVQRLFGRFRPGRRPRPRVDAEMRTP